MKKYRKWIQIGILSVFVVLGAVTIAGTFSASGSLAKEGNQAPEFTLYDLNGQKHSLSDFRGKAVIVNFWGTFCPPCKNEMPAIQNQYDKWKDQGLEVLGLNLGESKVTIDSFVRQEGIRFPVLMDRNLDTASNKYNVTRYPTTFFVRPDGVIHKVFVGEMNEQIIEGFVREIMPAK
ncbi:thiol-disulfide oxidoreductase ResA [Paenibacillus sp. J2TS4]|uniref:thiol-disulfide oxidoreductase ResA n=1 Tax=Paenibacillus sp. J2TS4 TaxID=2807194 RepID=UPI001B15A0C6|nr:thiol-disulfide oxidoreductase ResA [Paenibacillus sp. J2TS4]GIP31523.1 thiol-disulfide oxidoreductase ResA [Paenibacillus sp. J2TS4]